MSELEEKDETADDGHGHAASRAMSRLTALAQTKNSDAGIAA